MYYLKWYFVVKHHAGWNGVEPEFVSYRRVAQHKELAEAYKFVK